VAAASRLPRALLNIVQTPGKLERGKVLFHPPEGGGAVDLVGLDPNGREIREYRGRRIAMIFQDPMACLSPVHTIGSQIVESIRIHYPGVAPREARRRAIELLDEVGIPEPRRHLKSYSFELSGGMRQRARMAVALAAEPDLLIADEPTTAIDVTIQAKFVDLLSKLEEERDMSRHIPGPSVVAEFEVQGQGHHRRTYKGVTWRATGTSWMEGWGGS